MNSKDYKREALDALKGRWGGVTLAYFVFNAVASIPIIIMLFIMVICMLMGTLKIRGSHLSIGKDINTLLGMVVIIGIAVFICTLLLFFIIGIMHVGMYGIFINVVKDGEYKPSVGDVFRGAKYCLKVFGLYVVMWTFITLWSLLLIVPGIIKAFSYSMAPFIIAENPETRVIDAISMSKEMMQGNKWRLFCLSFSFIGWCLLASLLSYIPAIGTILSSLASIGIYVYMFVAMARFYINVSGQDYTIIKDETDSMFTY